MFIYANIHPIKITLDFFCCLLKHLNVAITKPLINPSTRNENPCVCGICTTHTHTYAYHIQTESHRCSVFPNYLPNLIRVYFNAYLKMLFAYKQMFISHCVLLCACVCAYMLVQKNVYVCLLIHLRTKCYCTYHSARHSLCRAVQAMENYIQT